MNKQKGRYSGKKTYGTVTGRIDQNPKGFGFLIMESGDDLFISREHLMGAMHGDTVEAVKLDGKNGGEARVTNILTRAVTRIVGIFRADGKGGGIVVADGGRLPPVFVIEDGGAKSGEKVVVKLTDYKKPSGKIVEVLGDPAKIDVEIRSILRSYGLFETFRKQTLAEAEGLNAVIEANGRTDFRQDTIITIDGDDSKDFDDAVGLVKRNGKYILGVHIADVAHYVAFKGKLDKEAYDRGNSFYFADRVLPMLPERLSNDLCSLLEGEDRLTLSVIMTFNDKGALIKRHITEGIIRSKARMTYKKTAAILAGDRELTERYAFLVPMLAEMKELALKLKQRRRAAGEVEFDLPECEFVIEDNQVKDILRRERLVSHDMIEQFMLAANETVASYMEGLKAPFIYRVHTPPPAKKLEALNEYLGGLGLARLGDAVKPADVAALLSEAPEPLKPQLNKVALRSMAKATYEPSNGGHFGLASECYCHFTSPIRRYPDLAIHRIIKDYLKEGKQALNKYAKFTAEAAVQSSQRERLAEEAERKVDDLLKARYMKQKLGNNYRGIVSGVTEWGIFVELDNTVEGLIRIENLPGHYEYDRAMMRLIAAGGGYSLGDEVDITVAGVTNDRIEFVLQSGNGNK